MENKMECIEKLRQMTALMKELQVELMIMKEYLSRYIQKRDQNSAIDDKDRPMRLSFEGEPAEYRITPQQIMDLLEPYKI
jgi:hypothetical protein